MFKSFDGTVYWQVGDMVLTRYFGNDEERYSTMVAAEVVEVDEKVAYTTREGETALCRIRIEDSIAYHDDEGNHRTDVHTYRWSSQLYPIEEKPQPLSVVYLLWVTKEDEQGEHVELYGVYGCKSLALDELSRHEECTAYTRVHISTRTVLFT